MIWLARFTETSDSSFLLNDGKTQKIYICQLGMTTVLLGFNRETFYILTFSTPSVIVSTWILSDFFTSTYAFLYCSHLKKILNYIKNNSFANSLTLKNKNKRVLIYIHLVSSDSWVSQRLPFLISKSLKSVYASNPSNQGCMIDLSTEYRFRLLT